MICIEGLTRIPETCTECRLVRILPFFAAGKERPTYVCKCIWTRELGLPGEGFRGRLRECPLRNEGEENGNHDFI